METVAVILAAGKGTRMRSRLPKVLHPLLGQPLAWYSIRAAAQAAGGRPLMVVGHGAEAVRAAFEAQADFVEQEPQLGTGHALAQAEAQLSGLAGQVLVLTADMPLLRAETLAALVDAQSRHPGPISMLTLDSADSHGFGRVLRRPDGSVQEIVEEAQASPEQLALTELNASVYCFDAAWLWPALKQIPLSPKGEYYLTDLVGIAVAAGLPVQAIRLADPGEAMGINTRLHLAEAGAMLRRRINEQWMLAGVTIVDPAATFIEPEVEIGMDTVIWPDTYLQGKTVIGEGCVIGPNSIVRSSRIGNECTVLASVIEYAEMENHVEIGPYGHLRKGAHLGDGVHMGNFGEVKNSTLGPGVKMGHFSYIGDATIGENVNIGAGTITCNFGLDGKKNKTEIGAGAFIGSDTMLVAPVKIGAGAATGSGSVVTKNVPDHSLAVGLPARVIRKLNPGG